MLFTRTSKRHWILGISIQEVQNKTLSIGFSQTSRDITSAKGYQIYKIIVGKIRNVFFLKFIGSRDIEENIKKSIFF